MDGLKIARTIPGFRLYDTLRRGARSKASCFVQGIPTNYMLPMGQTMTITYQTGCSHSLYLFMTLKNTDTGNLEMSK